MEKDAHMIINLGMVSIKSINLYIYIYNSYGDTKEPNEI